MWWLKSLWRRVRALPRGEEIEREIDEELRFHIEMRTEENVRAGMTPEEARRDAERRFGNPRRVRERGYEVRGGAWLESLWQDLRFGARLLVKRPGFTVVAVASLALGIGACTAIFSVVDGVLLRPLPFPEAERIVELREVGDKNSLMPFAEPNYVDVRERTRLFEAVAENRGGVANVTGGSEPLRAPVAVVSGEFFRVMGVAPHAGRTFAIEAGGAEHVAVVSYGFWRRALGGRADLSGAALNVYDKSFEVVGVMPQGFAHPGATDVWIPREVFPTQTSRTAHNWSVVGRLRPGVSVDEARAELSALGRRLKEEHGSGTDALELTAVPLQEYMVGHVRGVLMILLGAVALLLLIACANVANMMLAQATARRREVAVRAALGASRLRLARQFVTESILLALAAGALGALLSYWGVDLLLSLNERALPRAAEVGVDRRVLLFTTALSLLMAVALGLVSALRGTGADVQTCLKEAGRGASADAGGARLRGTLVVAQVALSLVLAVAAGLVARSFARLTSVAPGFRAESAVAMNVSLPSASDDEGGARQRQFHRQLLERLAHLPGVEAAGGTNSLPLTGVAGGGTFKVEGEPDATGFAEYRVVTPGYFEALGIPVVRGRAFEMGETPETAHSAVISQTLARKLWGDSDPIGKRIQFGNMDGDERLLHVVGVAGDVRERGLDAPLAPTVYANSLQRPVHTNFSFVARGPLDSASLVAAMREELRALDRGVPATFRTLDEVLSASLDSRRFGLVLFVVFAGVALLLAVTGVYGVMSYTVAQRTHEIGVRMALGAQAKDVLRMVVGRGLRLALAGVALGLAGALVLTRLMETMLYGVSTTDPLTYASVAALLLAVACAACLVPARRAARVDPMLVLRCE
ncbi:MAG TPA: ABC transporter permease [Pyrinomonadaceae bacterium]|nr:ABC transporter permease [Pyrinomonadaceae bacterium]